jgi:hypothetical protein
MVVPKPTLVAAAVVRHGGVDCHDVDPWPSRRETQARFDAEEVKAFSQKMSSPIESCWRVIEFLTQLPTDTKIAFTILVLSTAATLIAVRWLI